MLGKALQIIKKLPSNFDVNKYVNSYRDLLNLKASLENRAEELSEIIKGQLSKHKLSSEGGDLLSVVNKIKVYTLDLRVEKDELFRKALEESYHFKNIADNRKLISLLEKKYGKDLCTFISDVGDSYYESDRQIDTKKTKEAREIVKNNIKEFNKVTLDLNEVNKSLENIDKVSNFQEKLFKIKILEKQNRMQDEQN